MGPVLSLEELTSRGEVDVIDSPGICIEKNWISEEEESYALARIAEFGPTKEDPSGRSAVYRFGSTKDYGGHLVSREFPDFLKGAAHRVDARHAPSVTSITINVYEPGSFILPHVDSKRSGEIITVLSLGTVATLRFSDGRSFEMEPRSLFEMSGKPRWELSHEILPVKNRRVSIVFRRT